MSLDHSAITSTYKRHFQILAVIKDVEEIKAITCRLSALYYLAAYYIIPATHLPFVLCLSFFFSLIWEHHTGCCMGSSIHTTLLTRKDKEVLCVRVPDIVWKMDKVILLDYSMFFQIQCANLKVVILKK